MSSSCNVISRMVNVFLSFLFSAYFSNVFSPHYDVLAQVLKRLFKDKDRDVRYFASLNTSALPPLTKFESLLG